MKRALSWVAAAVLAAATAAHADPDHLAQRLVDLGFEGVRVAGDSSGCAVRLENRRFRDPNFALGVIGAAAAAECPGVCDVVLERQGVAVARVRFRSADVLELAAGRLSPAAFAERVSVELLPDDAPTPGPACSPAARRVDLEPRLFVDTEFGHIERPVNYHVEVAAEAATQPWRGALLRAGWTFPIQQSRDIPADANVPDYHHARPEEGALYQFVRLPHHAVVSLSGGYFGLDRYGVSAGVGLAPGRCWYLDAAADASGSVSFYPDIRYSSMTRITFQGSLTFRPPMEQDLAVGVRVGRFLYGSLNSSQGEYAGRLFASRRFHQVELAGFVVQSKYSKFGGIDVVVPIPPVVRPRPSAVRITLPERFPLEYRTDEGLFEKLPINWRLRAELLDDLWAGSVRAQADTWEDGARWLAARQPAPGGSP